MLLMMATYGLGAAEVLSLRLEGLDWKAGILRVHRPKTAVLIELPLLSQVAKAVTTYIKGERPPAAQTRHIFLRANMPYEQLTSGGIRHRIRSGPGSRSRSSVRLRFGIAMPRGKLTQEPTSKSSARFWAIVVLHLRLYTSESRYGGFAWWDCRYPDENDIPRTEGGGTDCLSSVQEELGIPISARRIHAARV